MYIYTIHEIPPTLNKYLGKWSRGAGQNYTKEKKRWEEMVYLATRGKVPSKPIKRANITYIYYMPDKRRRDADNYNGKFINDGLKKAGVIADDSWLNIGDSRVIFKVDRENPRTEIVVEHKR